MFKLWQFFWIISGIDLSEHGNNILEYSQAIIFIFLISRKWIDHPLSPWPPVEPLTTRWAFDHPLSPSPSIEFLTSIGKQSRPGFDPYAKYNAAVGHMIIWSCLQCEPPQLATSWPSQRVVVSADAALLTRDGIRLQSDTGCLFT